MTPEPDDKKKSHFVSPVYPDPSKKFSFKPKCVESAQKHLPGYDKTAAETQFNVVCCGVNWKNDQFEVRATKHDGKTCFDNNVNYESAEAECKAYGAGYRLCTRVELYNKLVGYNVVGGETCKVKDGYTWTKTECDHPVEH